MSRTAAFSVLEEATLSNRNDAATTIYTYILNVGNKPMQLDTKEVKYPNFFIIGMPRSGTKLLRELLNNHSEIFIPEVETLFIPKLLKKFGGLILTKKNIRSAIIEIKKSLFFMNYTKKNTFDLKKLNTNNINIVNLINTFYVELAVQKNIAPKIIGDKSPNYINNIPLISSYFPESKFIHIVRDPRDYALSVKKTWNKSLLRSIFKWSKGINEFQKAFLENKENMVEIRYEDLIENPRSEIIKCIKLLDLKYEEGMDQLFYSNEKLGDAKTTKIDFKNKQKYSSAMSTNEIKKIENYTIEFLKTYGYPYSTKRKKNKKTPAVQNVILKIHDAKSLIFFKIKENGFFSGVKKVLKAHKAH